MPPLPPVFPVLVPVLLPVLVPPLFAAPLLLFPLLIGAPPGLPSCALPVCDPLGWLPLFCCAGGVDCEPVLLEPFVVELPFDVDPFVAGFCTPPLLLWVPVPWVPWAPLLPNIGTLP